MSRALRGPTPFAGASGLGEPFEVAERRAAVGRAPAVGEAAPLVEAARARVGVPRVEADGLRGPRARDDDRMLEAAPSDAASLPRGVHRHVGEVERARTRGEAARVDGPRLLLREAPARDDGAALL